MNNIKKIADLIIAAETFLCPDCGTKVLETTKYCVKCKKKVEASKKTAASPISPRTWEGIGEIIPYFTNDKVIDKFWQEAHATPRPGQQRDAFWSDNIKNVSSTIKGSKEIGFTYKSQLEEGRFYRITIKGSGTLI